ncbi:N-succinylarginine dihydrolase [Allosphingosinicella indica]|uniref:N-succinylarginine dihydrolase n=1 Tax=Allosphingosinicella indica TaxID=941907 RepID=A0A1X7GKV2_9SPHN|nr:N-succinylarginine dihydrolase [Allosphingosinicella indica]SMF71175.1 succinylarginine dihydrolase [Allosphingosinicella indica]
MTLTEINFDGIIGPSHNYAGLSLGNIASASHAGQTSRPREAALQGIAKMRHNLRIGLPQGAFAPLPRPDRPWLAELGVGSKDAVPESLRYAAFSASAMWAANAATVSPAPDTADGRCHLTVANLKTMAHRSHEWPDTLRQLRLAFSDERHFRIHDPVPPAYGDEGAANHMRLCRAHDAAGVEVFVYGVSGGPFPARQHVEASRAIARLHGLDERRTIFAAQAEEAIAAGAFHNDVVAVANENVLFAHEQAFADKQALYADLRRMLPEVEIVEVPAARVSLADAVASYLFNAQLVTLPEGGMGLVLPEEARGTQAVWTWLQEMAAGNGPIRKLFVVDVRQSMANGGGPACLRLRVVADPATVDPRVLMDEAKLDRIASAIEDHWPETIAPGDLADPALVARIESARTALLDAMDLRELL